MLDWFCEWGGDGPLLTIATRVQWERAHWFAVTATPMVAVP
jgi:hypothetical protein